MGGDGRFRYLFLYQQERVFSQISIISDRDLLNNFCQNYAELDLPYLKHK